MLRFLVIALAAVAAIEGKTFRNPAFSGRDPNAIKVGKFYYVVESSNSEGNNQLPIMTSTDLESWKFAGFVFDESNIPSWANSSLLFSAPEIHKIGNKYHVYYDATPKNSSMLAIAVAVADTPHGPYKPTDAPITSGSDHRHDPTFINDNGNQYLVYTDLDSIQVAPLKADGLTLSSDEVTEALKVDLPWEGTRIEAPSYIRRGEYHYLLYSGEVDCKTNRAIGVARSRNFSGPYEKRGAPIVVSNKNFIFPSHISLVKDLDGQSDIAIFKANPVAGNCGNDNIILASIGWGSDDWPYIFDF